MSLNVHYGTRLLCSYVYDAKDPQLESPRPYFHPLYTLRGDLVTIFRPHDHVWHRGISLALPNVEGENFWGGPTYRRGDGYIQLPNNGAQRHDEFLRITSESQAVSVAHRLHWITEREEIWFRELRRFDVSVHPSHDAWVLAFTTALTNVSGREIVIGSPTTEGRADAGYGGLFWRGPRSFTGGRVYSATPFEGDPMGVRGPWLGFTGRHDGHGRSSTLVFVDAPENPGHPQTQWFVRSEIYACLCPAPFFSAEVSIADEESLLLRYAIVIADGDPGPDGVAELAKVGASALCGRLMTWRLP